MQTISIIIPVYNRAHIVERTLQSVLAQKYRPLEVVLVDNDSTDDSLAVLERWADANRAANFDVKVVSESYHTAGAARNRGAMVASGEWLVFFDSDDEMHQQLISDYVHEVEKINGEVDIVSTGATLKYTDGSLQALPFHTSDMLAVQILNSQLATQRYMVRATFFHKCGEWNVDLPVWNDWELGIRLLLGNPRLAFMKHERVTVNHSGEASITGSSFSSKAGRWENSIRVAEENVMASQCNSRQRLLRLLDFKRITLAAMYEREGNHDLSIELFNKAFNSLGNSYRHNIRWKLYISSMVKFLFALTVNGKRGASFFARKLF